MRTKDLGGESSLTRTIPQLLVFVSIFNHYMIASFVKVTQRLHHTPRRGDMRAIAIVPRPSLAVEQELNDSISCLKKAGIDACNTVSSRSFGLIWVDDENLSISVDALRDAGFQATVLSDTNVPH
jgi:hypothetical protein